MNLIARLKRILAVPSVTGDETRLVDFLVALLTKKGITHEVDHMGNIIATKGSADYYPCLVAHSDTVHQINGDIEIRDVMREDYKGDTGLALTGYCPGTDIPSGCGGDDKSGIFICLEIFDTLDTAKMFFPVQEETGCHGSNAAPADWFDDVGYFIQFDSPHGDTMSRSLLGRDIYQEDGEFYGLISEQLEYIEPQRHPYTDVAALGRRFGVECLNLPAGYYLYHHPDEYVMIGDVIRSIKLGKSLVATLGNHLYLNDMEPSPPPILRIKTYDYSPTK